MKAKELKKKYFEFFTERQHKLIDSSSLIPEHDPTVLFTTAGMHPLVAYIMGQPHPSGKRLVDVQKCIRTGDIDEVGDPLAMVPLNLKDLIHDFPRSQISLKSHRPRRTKFAVQRTADLGRNTERCSFLFRDYYRFNQVIFFC